MLLGGCAQRAPAALPLPPAAQPLGEAQLNAMAALLRMEDERSIDLERWTELARDAHPEVRRRAILAGGRVADAGARLTLLGSLADSVVQVRAAAVFALGRLADTSSVVRGGLAGVLPGADSAAREVPAALARMNTPAAYEVLRAWLAGVSAAGVNGRAAARQAPVVTEALLALWRFRDRPGAGELAGAFTAAQDPHVRWAATYCLTRTAAAAQLPRLLELLDDADALVRATALRGVRAAAADSLGRADQARLALQHALADPLPHVRINAARALAAFRNPADAPVLLTLLRDPDGNVRQATAEVLGNLRAGSVSSALRLLASDTAAPLSLRAAALGSLARADSAAAPAAIRPWADATSWLQRLYATRALASLAWPHQQELLIRLGRDPDPRVQGEAFGILAEVDSTVQLGKLFIEGLAAGDPLVRAHAATGLARRRDPAYFSALMQAYDRAQRDSLNDAALAAVDALGRLAEHGVPVAGSFFLRFQPARDPVVRTRVAQRLGSGAGTWGKAGPVATPRPDSFYLRVVSDVVAPVLAGAGPPHVVIRTKRGDIVLALAAAAAPLTVHNFLSLVRSGFYRGADLRWHRVVPNFVLQDGDPRGDGSGGPGHAIRDEINPLRYGTGTLGMALSGPDTGGSQFFITHSPQPHLDGGYTVFGNVVAGMEVADAVLQDDPILAIELLR